MICTVDEAGDQTGDAGCPLNIDLSGLPPASNSGLVLSHSSLPRNAPSPSPQCSAVSASISASSKTSAVLLLTPRDQASGDQNERRQCRIQGHHADATGTTNRRTSASISA
jgi:hypothetical protein